MTDRASNSNASASLRSLRHQIAELERQARTLSDATTRHDVTNALGAARNAIIMLDEGEDEGRAARFVEIAERNVRQAQAMIHRGGNDPGRRESVGDQRNDLGREGERDHPDAFGL
jgi:hypothetical protein